VQCKEVIQVTHKIQLSNSWLICTNLYLISWQKRAQCSKWEVMKTVAHWQV